MFFRNSSSPVFTISEMELTEVVREDDWLASTSKKITDIQTYSYALACGSGMKETRTVVINQVIVLLFCCLYSFSISRSYGSSAQTQFQIYLFTKLPYPRGSKMTEATVLKSIYHHSSYLRWTLRYR